jgi:2-polyprenyl-3-methyl-5-hydroxy-6-metoxy-1,4-benzoquinol methylase
MPLCSLPAQAMAGSGELVLHLGTLRRAHSPEEVVTAALRSGFHFSGVEVHERPAGWTVSLYAGAPGPVEMDIVTLPPMSSNWRRYDWPIDMDNEGDSRAVVLHLLGDAHTVLELGCSAGRMTRVMQEMGISVTAVEVDSDAAAEAAGAAEATLVLDLEVPDALAQLGDQQYDLVIAADVLEHLRHPAACLAQAVPLLRPDGRLIVSIPNVAHGDLRLALLEGRFEYTDIGLLDRTHISFFTHERLSAFLAEAGLWPVAWHRTRREIGETETPLRPELVEWGKLVLADDPEATTYQWIVECKRIGDVAEDQRVTETPPRAAPLEERLQQAGAALWAGPTTPRAAPPAEADRADVELSASPRSRWRSLSERVLGRNP